MYEDSRVDIEIFHTDDSALALDVCEYAKNAMLDCVANTGAGVNNWFSKLSNLLRNVHGGTMPEHAMRIDGSVDVQRCLELRRKYHHTIVWGNLSTDPRKAPRDNVTMCTYHYWFGTDLTDEDHWEHTGHHF
jgi:hypothetical protein